MEARPRPFRVLCGSPLVLASKVTLGQKQEGRRVASSGFGVCRFSTSVCAFRPASWQERLGFVRARALVPAECFVKWTYL